MKTRKTKQSAKNRGFTIIEMLIVVFIFALLSVSITTTVKQIILSSQHLRNVQIAQIQAQEAYQYLVKLARMSEYPTSQGDCQAGCNLIQLNWRKASGKTYVVENKVIDETLITSFFEGASIEPGTFLIYAQGINGVNRVTVVFDLKVGTSETHYSTIPMQMTVSLRSFNVES